MLAEVYGIRPFPQRPAQLSLNLFDDGSAAACRASLVQRRFDLVYSFEVAEHVPSQMLPTLVTTLAAATGRFLVFSAAKPGQPGTGHIKGSMLTKRKWVKLFSQQGLVLMPKLSAVVARSAYPERHSDVGVNVFVMRATDAPVDDELFAANVTALPIMRRHLVHPLRKEPPLDHWRVDDPEPVPEWKQLERSAAGATLLYESALWPELHALQELLKLCPRSANAKERAKYCC